jgi:hypothetical protein
MAFKYRRCSDQDTKILWRNALMPVGSFWLATALIGISIPRTVAMDSIMESHRCQLLHMLRRTHLDVLVVAIKVVLDHTRSFELEAKFGTGVMGGRDEGETNLGGVRPYFQSIIWKA